MSTDIDLKIARKFISLSQSAKARGKVFSLTLQSLRNIHRATKCYYTGVPLTHKNRTIDRVDNSKGYEIGNVVACDREFNLRKADLSVEDIDHLYKILVRRGDIA